MSESTMRKKRAPLDQLVLGCVLLLVICGALVLTGISTDSPTFKYAASILFGFLLEIVLGFFLVLALKNPPQSISAANLFWSHTFLILIFIAVMAFLGFFQIKYFQKISIQAHQAQITR